MATMSSPLPQLSSSATVGADEVDPGRMNCLLEELKSSMVELILQGDDVTRQMWHMYSVFEEIFGRQTMTTSSNQPLKHVVVGDRLKGSPMAPSKHKTPERPSSGTPTSPLASSPVSSSVTIRTTTTLNSATTTTTTPTTTTSAVISSPTTPTVTTSSPKDTKTSTNVQIPSPQNKKPNQTPSQAVSDLQNLPPFDRSSDSSSTHSGHLQSPRVQQSNSSNGSPLAAVGPSANPTSNPLLDTIGTLANSNPDSDDSDLDIVYQQLRYRARQQRKPEQMRIRPHRTHRHQHQQVASSDPESIGYAGSNSIDSGYKSLCATPEVSDSLSAPEVRRSASDVSASDSSTTSGRPRSLDGQDSKSTKIKMGTRSIAGKLKAMDRSPRQMPAGSTMNDVTLDHLMYLRQSLRKDRSDIQRSPNDSIPSSATSSTFRDSDLSPRTMADEDWRDPSQQYPFGRTTSSSSESTFTAREGPRSSSRGEEIDQEGGGESSSDFLLSGVEYYDLESIQEFPPSNNYVTMLEEKTRCARFKLVSASKCTDPMTERQLSSLYRRRSESSQSVDGDIGRSHQHQQQHTYGIPSPHQSRSVRSSSKLSRHHRQHHTTDSKLTEAAIRVLEMIEDFRMEEAISRSGRLMPYQGDRHPQVLPPEASSSNYPSADITQQTFHPRYRKTSGLRPGVRPASTGSLMEHEMDARSVASSYAASAEHHVYEEIMYDLVCERGMPPPVPPDRGRIVRSRLLPVPPHSSMRHHQQAYAASVDPRRIMVRSHKHRSSNMYSVLPSTHGRSNVDRFLEMEWHLSQERRDNLPPDYPL